MNNQIPKAPLKDRMIVYVGVASIILVSWAYIIGMGWHMGTLPFSDPMQMDMKTMDMDKMDMAMDNQGGLINSLITWMPPSQGAWLSSDFFLLFLMVCDDDSYDDPIHSSHGHAIYRDKRKK